LLLLLLLLRMRMLHGPLSGGARAFRRAAPFGFFFQLRANLQIYDLLNGLFQ